MQNLTIPSPAIPEISLGALKFKVGHKALTTPLLKMIRHFYAGVNIVYLCTKFYHSSFPVPEIWLVPTKIEMVHGT